MHLCTAVTRLFNIGVAGKVAQKGRPVMQQSVDALVPTRPPRRAVVQNLEGVRLSELQVLFTLLLAFGTNEITD